MQAIEFLFLCHAVQTIKSLRLIANTNPAQPQFVFLGTALMGAIVKASISATLVLHFS